jgi:putative flippase GtrA
MSELFNWEILWKFIRFGLVGISGMGVDFGTTYLCKEIIRIPKYIANAIGFTLAASSNYIFNRIWTFHSQDPGILVEYSKFFFISLIGLGINTLILWILVSRFNRNFYISKLFAIGITMIWNFLANLLFTFR